MDILLITFYSTFMKTIKTWLATIALLLCSISANASDFEVNGLYYNILSAADRTVEMAGNGIYGDIIVPSNVKFNNIDFTVTRIGEYAFINGADIEYQITSVILPNTIKSIGSYAFQNCFSLKEIVIPEGVTRIEAGTFMSCGALEKIKLSTNISYIGEAAFQGCGISYIKLPSNLTIENDAFSSVSTVLLQPWGRIEFSDYQNPFNDNTLFILRHEEMPADFDGDGIDETTLPSYYNYMGGSGMDKYFDNIVSYDPDFTNAEIDYILETGGMVTLNGVKYRITSLLNTYTMEVFGSDYGITTADISSKINYLNREFTVTRIKESAFANKTALETVKIPNSITSIGNNAFAGCTALSKVTTESITPLSINDGCFDVMAQLFATLYVPVDAVETYKSAAVWKGFGNIVAIANPSSTIDSGTYTNGDTELTWEFTSEGELKIEGMGYIYEISEMPWAKYQNEIKKVFIGEGRTTIGTYAFKGCSNMTSISLSEGITSIGGQAFWGCSNLTDITIPESVTSIGGQAFNECNSLTSIIIPESVTSIGNQIFTGCKKLTSIIFNASVSSVDLHEVLAFGAPNVKSLYIGRHVAGIKIPNAMESCNWSCLEQLVVDEDNPTYDSRDNCNAIIETATNKLIVGCGVTIVPNSVSFIGPRAFAFLGNLTNMVIPDHVVVIDNAAFYGCTNLAEVYISSLASHIVHQAFGNCQGLKSITCGAINPPIVVHPSGAPEQYGAFYGVSKSECVLYVPEESIEAYKAADTWKEFTNIQAMMRSIELSDDTESFVQSKVTECASLTYTRTFTNTNWQALYVPFEIPVTEELLADFEVAELNDIRQYDRDDDGVKDETVVEAFKVKSGATLAANYPYLIRAKEVGEKTITVEDATLYATEEISIDCSSIREKFTFTGTYSRLSSEQLPQGEGYYALSGGVWQPVAEGASLGAFRFYLKVDSRSGVNAMQGNAIRMRIIGEDGEEDDATGIDTPEFKDQKSELIFDLQGRRVENPTKGVYIVNGVKRVF